MIDGESKIVFIEDEFYNELNDFLNQDVKEVIVKGIIIDHINIENLIKLELERLTFIDCSILAFQRLGELKVKEIYFKHCKCDDIRYLNNIEMLESLYLDEMHEVDLENLSIIKKLRKLSLYNTQVSHDEYFVFMHEVEMLRIDETGIDDLSFCMVLDQLKDLVIDKEQALGNRELIMKLQQKGVHVVNGQNQSVVMYYE